MNIIFLLFRTNCYKFNIFYKFFIKNVKFIMILITQNGLIFCIHLYYFLVLVKLSILSSFTNLKTALYYCLFYSAQSFRLFSNYMYIKIKLNLTFLTKYKTIYIVMRNLFVFLTNIYIISFNYFIIYICKSLKTFIVDFCYFHLISFHNIYISMQHSISHNLLFFLTEREKYLFLRFSFIRRGRRLINIIRRYFRLHSRYLIWNLNQQGFSWLLFFSRELVYSLVYSPAFLYKLILLSGHLFYLFLLNGISCIVVSLLNLSLNFVQSSVRISMKCITILFNIINLLIFSSIQYICICIIYLIYVIQLILSNLYKLLYLVLYNIYIYCILLSCMIVQYILLILKSISCYLINLLMDVFYYFSFWILYCLYFIIRLFILEVPKHVFQQSIAIYHIMLYSLILFSAIPLKYLLKVIQKLMNIIYRNKIDLWVDAYILKGLYLIYIFSYVFVWSVISLIVLTIYYTIKFIVQNLKMIFICCLVLLLINTLSYPEYAYNVYESILLIFEPFDFDDYLNQILDVLGDAYSNVLDNLLFKISDCIIRANTEFIKFKVVFSNSLNELLNTTLNLINSVFALIMQNINNLVLEMYLNLNTTLSWLENLNIYKILSNVHADIDFPTLLIFYLTKISVDVNEFVGLVLLDPSFIIDVIVLLSL